MSADFGDRRIVGVVAMLAGVLALSGCINSSDEDTPDGPTVVSGAPFTTPSTESWDFPVPTAPATPSIPRTLPDGVAVDRASADSVALAAARIWYAWDTTRDTSPFDAALRATPLMGPTCQQRMIASAPTGSPGDDWTRLARAHARATVEAALGSEERPVDRGDRAVRIVGVTQKFTASPAVQTRHVAAMIVLTRTAGRWSVGSPTTGTCGVVTR